MKNVMRIVILVWFCVFQCSAYCDYFKIITFKEEKTVNNYKFLFNIDIPFHATDKENKYIQNVVKSFYKERLDILIPLKEDDIKNIAIKNYEKKVIAYYMSKLKKYPDYKKELEDGIMRELKFSEGYDNGVIFSFSVSEKYDKKEEHNIEGGTFNVKKKKELFAHEIFGTDEENSWTHFSGIKEGLDLGYQKIASKGSCKSLKDAIAANEGSSPDDFLALAPMDRPLGVPFIFTKNKELYFWGVTAREDTDKPWDCKSLSYEMAWPISYDWLKKIVDKNNPLTPYVD